MAESGDQRGLRDSSDLMGRCLVSLVFSSLTQLVLYTVAKFFPSSSLLALLYFSVMALLGLAGVGRCSKTLLRVRASAPAFVFFNIIFIWGVYIGVVRQVISPLMDFILNSELLMLMIGLSSMLSTDPGFVTKDSSHHLNIPLECPVSVVEPPSKELVPSTSDLPYDFAAEDRVRYCRLCKSYVKGFDHHCPAFGNCIGQKNHILFVVLLVGFISTEASYVACSSQFTTKIQILDKTEGLTSLSRTLAISTMLFSLLQVLWQGVFLAWHIYCVCFNIKTDEWINWKRYPEFNVIVQPEPEQTRSKSETKFTNPYDKGILWNVKEFLTKKA